jgi:ornithine--oxo-acid transaminase
MAAGATSQPPPQRRAEMPVGSVTTDELARADLHSAHNYAPLPIVVRRAEGAWVEDVDGVTYLDMLSAYSALNFGHRHPALVAAAVDQISRLTLTSRAFQHDQFAAFCTDLAELCGKDAVLPMNTGTEAVETALKVTRKWGYDVKGVAADRARIIVCRGNFHGRTITIVGFSTDAEHRDGFGPFTPGFTVVPYGDGEALAAAFDDDTVGVLVEPIQGENGVIVPPAGYLQEVRRLCTEHGALMIADEIQSGLGRTGETFACEHEDVVPDIYIVGKALGGGIIPVSAIAADWPVMGVLHPGEHGSTFGGNPLACAVGRAVISLLRTGEYQERSRLLGEHLHAMLRDLPSTVVREVRGRGLWAGIDMAPGQPAARVICERLLARGVLAKDTHHTTIRLAPPLVVTADELEWGVTQLRDALLQD